MTIMVDGVEYVRKENSDNYVIVRCDRSGVFAGYLKELNGTQGTILNARRLWYWSGAASLSQLAMEGVKKPSECKFPCEVDLILVTDVIEVLNVTPEAKKSIANVPVWQC